MEPGMNKSKLEDILNYDPGNYFSDQEIGLIQSTFHDNPALINLLRKILLPTLGDPEMPIEQYGNDVYLTSREWAQIPADEAKVLMVARQDAIKFVAGGLIRLKVIAQSRRPSDQEAAAKAAADSAK